VKKYQRIFALLLTVLMVGSLMAGCGGGQAGTDSNGIKIGADLELTGGISTFGNSTLNGVKLAFKEINAAGGVLGKQITLISEDNKSEPAETANAVKKLIEQDQVLAVIGAVASSNTLAAAPIAQAAGVPMITATSTNPQVTETGDYIFRTCFIDPFQGTVMSKFATNTLKAKTAAILVDMTSDYSKGLTEVFKNDFQKLGGKIVAEESFAQKDTDYNAQLTKIKAANPDVVYVPAYYTEVGLILKQARQLGLKQPFLGTDGWDSPKLTEIAGTATDKGYFSNHYSPDDTAPAIQDFVKKYQAEYGQVPDALATLGYEAGMIVADAIKRAGKVDRQALRDALAATKDFPATTGNITLDENRNPIKAAVIIEMKDGKQTFLEKVNP